MISCDQKGLHYNEGESKGEATLALIGETVELKTNHSQSRSRLSLMTMVSTNPLEEPPIEILFKLKTGRQLQGLCVPDGVRMSFANSDSGSYREEHVLTYLRRWLPEWSQSREAKRDYGIILLDAYTAHKSLAVKELARERGYLRIMYGGGITSILQWNDTDLHARIERSILELENDDFHRQLEKRPWRVPTRERQSLVDDVGAVWASLPHASIATQASKKTGLRIALPQRSSDGRVHETGPEDAWVTREASEFFRENNLPKKRAAALLEIYRAFDEGELSNFLDVERFLEDFPDGDDGEHVEGQEIDPPLDAHEDERDSDGAADSDAADKDTQGDDSHEDQQTGSFAEACGSESDAALAERVASTLHAYDNAIAAMASDPLAANYLRMRRTEAWKLLRRTDPETQKVLTDFLAKDRREMEELRAKLRHEDDERREQQKREKEAALAKKAALEAKKEEEKRAQKLQELAASIPRCWSLVDFGQGSSGVLPPKAAANIRDVLARVRALGAELPDELAAQWAYFLEGEPKQLHVRFGPAIGHGFKTLVTEVLKKVQSGNQNAFHQFVRERLAKRNADIKV